MKEILYFTVSHKYFAVSAMMLNIILARFIIQKLLIHISGHIREATGGRNERKSLYKKCRSFIEHSIKLYEKRGKKSGIYHKAEEKMRKSGYRSEYAPYLYIMSKYIISLAFFIAAFIANFPSLFKAFAAAMCNIIIVECVVGAARKKLNLKFQRYVYKIYKYLHNQISSGVKVTDAIKTVYEVIDDRELRAILIKLAARYELTNDIDAALEEFSSNFELQEAQTLCVALKQGIETGDNQELLARQEEVMFMKYFNYIQMETDNCKIRSTLAAAMFTAVIIIMVFVPLFSDMSDALSKIFVN
jgi:Flp pilus assembly protein TadB